MMPATTSRHCQRWQKLASSDRATKSFHSVASLASVMIIGERGNAVWRAWSSHPVRLRDRELIALFDE